MRKAGLLFILITSLLLIACNNEDNTTKVAVKLSKTSQTRLTDSVATGTKAMYDIEAFSTDTYLKKFTITSFDQENGEILLFESAPEVKNYQYSFVYDAPSFSADSVKVTLKMRAENYIGDSYEMRCTLVVTGGAQLLTELSGIILNSASSGKADALSLNNPSQVFLAALADSASIDIYDLVNESNPEILSREWRTNTDVRFVKINSFNYSEATTASIKSTYLSSLRDKAVSNLQENDIILVGKENTPMGVFQITGITDNEGFANDYYRFSAKMIK